LSMLHHKGSIPHPHRLSAAFTSKLTDVIEKNNERKSHDLRRLSLITVSDSRSSKDSSHGSLQEVLDHAVLAETPTDPYLIQENKYPFLRNLRTDEDIGDGLWICCYCHHENTLRHWKGPFPFKYIHCDRCTRILCSSCHSSEVLTPWPYGMISAPRPAPGREVRYCHVCVVCGLSHRAEMEGTTLDFYGVTCSGCGITSYGDWPRFHIGNVEPYRRDPDPSFVKLIEARVDDAVKLAFQWELASVESRPPSRLSCRSPG
ncbi:hypothetical protein CC86DRAFT_280589, partial [Ophiobolus disseminans]